MKARKGHFMKETMLDSQLVTLVPPSIDERGSATIKLGKGVDEGEEVGLEGVVQRSLEVVRIWGFQ
jgi:gluconate kinase